MFTLRAIRLPKANDLAPSTRAYVTDFDPEYWQKKYEENPLWVERFLTGKEGPDHPSRIAARRILEELGKVEGRTLSVLDLGCGPGITRQSFEGLDITYVGVDATLGMIEVASTRCSGQGTMFVHGDALEEVNTRKLDGEPFDIVHIRAVLEHIPPDKAWALLEAAISASSVATVVTFFRPTVEGDTDLIRMARDGAPVYVSSYSHDKLTALAQSLGVQTLKLTVSPLTLESTGGEDIPFGKDVEYAPGGEVWVFTDQALS